MSKHYEDQVVYISGAASGFGKLAAKKFSAEGAKLALTDLNAEGLDTLVSALKAKGVKVISHAGNIADETCSKTLLDKVMQEFGRLDVAINNAGIGHKPAKLAQVDIKEAKYNMDVNVMGVFYAMQQQLPIMETQSKETGIGGAILNVASVAGLVGAPTMSMYAAAKHAVVGMSKSAALEYARRNIRINILCPSFAKTPMVMEGLLNADESPEAEQNLVRGIPMRRLATADEVVQSMLFICDKKNSFMTGQAIAVDGGLTAM